MSAEQPPKDEEKIKSPDNAGTAPEARAKAMPGKSPEELAKDAAELKKNKEGLSGTPKARDATPDEKAKEEEKAKIEKEQKEKEGHGEEKASKMRFIDRGIPANILLAVFGFGKMFFSWAWKKIGGKSEGGGSSHKDDSHTGALGHGGGGSGHH